MSMDRTYNKNYTTIYTQMKYLCEMLKEKPLGICHHSGQKPGSISYIEPKSKSA